MPIIPKPMETEAQSRSQQKDILTEVLQQKKISVTIRGPQCEEIIHDKTIRVKMSLVHDGLVGL